MKKISLFLILISSAFLANCQTIIPGGIVSGIWTQEGSPYLVEGSIMISNGETLTIEPGVAVEFQDFYKLLVLGSIQAIGTITDSISLQLLI